MVETAHANSKEISSLNRGEHGSTSFTNGSNGNLLLRFGIGRRRHVWRAACRRGIGGSGSRIEGLFLTAADKCIIGDKGNVPVCLSLCGSGSRSHSGLHHPLLNSLRVSFVQTTVECIACLINDRDHAWVDVVGQQGAVVES